MSVIPGYDVDIIPLFDFGSDQAVDNATADVTYYGPEVDFDREIVGAKFFGETAITGGGASYWQLAIYYTTGSTCGYLNFKTGTDHTANTHTDFTLVGNAGATARQVQSGVMYTVGCDAVGTPTMLHTNSRVVIQWAPVSHV